MGECAPNENDKSRADITRIGGFAILLGLSIHMYVNVVLKQFPPEHPSLVELQAYLAKEASTWAIVHGCRYVAFLCIALFGAGLFARTSCPLRSHPNWWGVVGLLGCTMLLANALITNGIEILVFLDFERLSEDPTLFWLLFNLTRVLWTAEMVAWGILILGFSLAGWHSRMIPKWLAGFGLLSAAGCVLSSAFVVSILNDGWAVVLIEIASLAGLGWFAIVGVYMLLNGASSAGEARARTKQDAQR